MAVAKKLIEFSIKSFLRVYAEVFGRSIKHSPHSS